MNTSNAFGVIQNGTPDHQIIDHATDRTEDSSNFKRKGGKGQALLVIVPEFYSRSMIYATILAAVFSAISIVRIVFLNSEIKTLDTVGVKFHTLIESWEAQNPIDYTTPETYAASKEKMPKELQDVETEYAWLSNERDSKKESRTVWYGGAFLSLVALAIALSLLIGNSH